jgi:hypothetical protein
MVLRYLRAQGILTLGEFAAALAKLLA